MAPRTAILFLAALLFHAAILPAAPSQRELDVAHEVVQEYVTQLEQRCYYPLTIPGILDGVVRELNRFGIGAERGRDTPLAQVPDAEAWQTLRDRLATLAAQPGQRLSPQALVDQALTAHSKTIDVWSRYITPEDVSRIQGARNSDITSIREGPVKTRTSAAGGIGMTLREVSGEFFCYPFPDSAAQKAGVQPGDKLISVDGQRVTNRPQEVVAAWFQGVPGSKLTLQLQSSGRDLPALEIQRVVDESSPILVTEELGALVLRVRRMPDGVAELIHKALKDQPPESPVTLDFRGCPGGSMLAAVDVSALFLEPGKLIFSLVERGQPPVEYRSEKPARLHPGHIYLLQDENTGSAAEIIIAALVENLPGKAISQGAPTRGKGVVQDPIPLLSGGILRLTTGMMFGPGGKTWNGSGLLPSENAPNGIYPADALKVQDRLARPRVPVKLVD